MNSRTRLVFGSIPIAASMMAYYIGFGLGFGTPPPEGHPWWVFALSYGSIAGFFLGIVLVMFGRWKD